MVNLNSKLKNSQPEILSSSGADTFTSFKSKIEEKFKDVNYILLSVVLILIVMVATLIIDSFHINSTTYKEYSEKLQIIETLKKEHLDLLNQNKNNQEIIIRLQKEILKLLQNK